MTSNAPPASPALIMLTYRRSKALGRLGHRLRQRGTTLNLFAGIHQRVLQPPRLALFFQDLQAAENRQAGVLQDRQLTRERRQIPAADTPDRQATFLAAFAFSAADLRDFFTEIFVTK